MSRHHPEIERLSPGYFALVMGTGIVSIGLHDVGQEAASSVLLVLAALAYVVLWVLYVWRAVAYRPAVLADLRNPEAAFAYFTVVAATDVLAVRLMTAGSWASRCRSSSSGRCCGSCSATCCRGRSS